MRTTVTVSITYISVTNYNTVSAINKYTHTPALTGSLQIHLRKLLAHQMEKNRFLQKHTYCIDYHQRWSNKTNLTNQQCDIEHDRYVAYSVTNLQSSQTPQHLQHAVASIHHELLFGGKGGKGWGAVGVELSRKCQGVFPLPQQTGEAMQVPLMGSGTEPRPKTNWCIFSRTEQFLWNDSAANK